MPHISTVNERTLPPAINQGFIAITGSLGKQWYRTIADLFADVLSTRPGDSLFFQLTNRSVGTSSNLQDYLSYVNFDEAPPFTETSNGFSGVFEIKGKPFFDPTDIGQDAIVPKSVPIRVPLNCERYFPNPVTEDRAFTYETSPTELWNPKYKKALRGAKSLTSMTPKEGKQLETLIHKNNDRGYTVNPDSYSGNTAETISINDRLDQKPSTPGVRTSSPDSIEQLSLDEIPITKGNKFRVEKTLEAWLMEMIDSEHKGLRKIFGPSEELVWFTNYVPYGITGTNMDGLAFHRREGVRYKISTIELKRGKGGASAVEQVINYSRWVTDYLANGDQQIVQPVLIAHEFSDDAIKAAKSQIVPRRPKLVSYRIEDGNCILNIEVGM